MCERAADRVKLRKGDLLGIELALSVSEEDEQEPDNHEALASPEQERPLDHVNARFGNLTLQSGESGGHFLTKVTHVLTRRHLRAENGDLLPDRGGFLRQSAFKSLVRHRENFLGVHDSSFQPDLHRRRCHRRWLWSSCVSQLGKQRVSGGRSDSNTIGPHFYGGPHAAVTSREVGSRRRRA